MVALVKGSGYRESIKELLLQKGDTDTNACIAGGILGACEGVVELKMDE